MLSDSSCPYSGWSWTRPSFFSFVVDASLFLQFPVQFLNVQPCDPGDDLAAEIRLHIAPDVLLIAAQSVGPQGDGTVLLHPAIQPLAQSHAAVLGELCVLIDIHVTVKLSQQLFLSFGQHISEDGLAVFLVAHYDAAFPTSVFPLADHAVPGWSSLCHVVSPPIVQFHLLCGYCVAYFAGGYL